MGVKHLIQFAYYILTMAHNFVARFAAFFAVVLQVTFE